jgi:hypothetical protein
MISATVEEKAKYAEMLVDVQRPRERSDVVNALCAFPVGVLANMALSGARYVSLADLDDREQRDLTETYPAFKRIGHGEYLPDRNRVYLSGFGADLIVHEAGHIIDAMAGTNRAYRSQRDPRVLAEFERGVRGGTLPTRKAGENVIEYFAESVRQYVGGERLHLATHSPMTCLVIERLFGSMEQAYLRGTLIAQDDADYWSAVADGSRYSGRIMDITPTYVVQDVGRGEKHVHCLSDLSGNSIELNADVMICYHGGKGIATRLEVEPDVEMSR